MSPDEKITPRTPSPLPNSPRLNAATGEVVMSDSFEHKLVSADPSTMPRVIDGKSMAAQMMDSLSDQIGSAIISEIFPVSIVALNGDQAVLSQGGDTLHAGQRWRVVYLGEGLKDPQTGRSLGRSEAPIGILRVDRVASQTSYGTLEEGSVGLGARAFVPGALELREQLSKMISAEARGAPAGGTHSASASQPAQTKSVTTTKSAGHTKGSDTTDEYSPVAAPTKDEKW